MFQCSPEALPDYFFLYSQALQLRYSGAYYGHCQPQPLPHWPSFYDNLPSSYPHFTPFAALPHFTPFAALPHLPSVPSLPPPPQMPLYPLPRFPFVHSNPYGQGSNQRLSLDSTRSSAEPPVYIEKETTKENDVVQTRQGMPSSAFSSNSRENSSIDSEGRTSPGCISSPVPRSESGVNCCDSAATVTYAGPSNVEAKRPLSESGNNVTITHCSLNLTITNSSDSPTPHSTERSQASTSRSKPSLWNPFTSDSTNQIPVEQPPSSSSENIPKEQQNNYSSMKYNCKTCLNSFTRKSNLERHLRLHTGERPFVCSECGNKFSQAANLNYHQRIHSQERPFNCSSCRRRFRSSSHLKRHQRIHTGEKPYKCVFCSHKFSSWDQKKRHLKLEHN